MNPRSIGDTKYSTNQGTCKCSDLGLLFINRGFLMLNKFQCFLKRINFLFHFNLNLLHENQILCESQMVVCEKNFSFLIVKILFVIIKITLPHEQLLSTLAVNHLIFQRRFRQLQIIVTFFLMNAFFVNINFCYLNKKKNIIRILKWCFMLSFFWGQPLASINIFMFSTKSKINYYIQKNQAGPKVII